MTRRIVCAANKNRNGDIILGPRHWDETMRRNFKIWMNQLYWDEQDNEFLTKFDNQGFIDQHGKFISRKQAWKIAEAAGQIIRRVGGDDADGGTLYSENIY